MSIATVSAAPIQGMTARWTARRRSSAARRGLVTCVLVAALQALAAAHELPDQDSLIRTLRDRASAYEYGAGVAQDGPGAVALYCEAARLGDAISQFELGWMYANGRGVNRNDRLAAFFFKAAADQGVEQARNMLPQVGDPGAETPECMRQLVLAGLSAPSAPELGAARAPGVEARRPVASAPRHIARLVMKLAPQYGVPPALALAIIRAESNFDARAVSFRNAQGLMQLIPDTAARFGVKDAFDPVDNIRGGLAYLRWLLGYFRGDVMLVAAAYNAGEGAVERYGGVPPYGETRDYVERVVGAVEERTVSSDGAAKRAAWRRDGSGPRK